jgi:hypothetical protein
MKNNCLSVFFILIAILLIGNAQAQVLSGVVFDEKEKPIEGASVYLNGSSVGTITDNLGAFRLEASSNLNTIMVISYIGYETIVVEKPFEYPHKEFRMKVLTQQIRAVTVFADRFTRTEKMAIFKSQFLGESEAAASCSILNEDAIQFDYDPNDNRLIARSEVPLQISNPYLGYLLKFDLMDFYVQFDTFSIKRENAVKSFFLGTSQFNDLQDIGKSSTKNRKKAYKGSSQHFFRALARHELKKEGFELLFYNVPYPQDSFFLVTDTVGWKKINVLPPPAKPFNIIIPKQTISQNKNKADGNNLNSAPKPKKVHIGFRNQLFSTIIFLQDTFYVDEFGNQTNISDMIFYGDMSKRKIAKMLPIDYNIE